MSPYSGETIQSTPIFFLKIKPWVRSYNIPKIQAILPKPHFNKNFEGSVGNRDKRVKVWFHGVWSDTPGARFLNLRRTNDYLCEVNTPDKDSYPSDFRLHENGEHSSKNISIVTRVRIHTGSRVTNTAPWSDNRRGTRLVKVRLHSVWSDLQYKNIFDFAVLPLLL